MASNKFNGGSIKGSILNKQASSNRQASSSNMQGSSSNKQPSSSSTQAPSSNKRASSTMMQTLQEEKIFHAPNKWENLHVQSHWKKSRVGIPSRKLRKMHSRNILLVMFDNLLFMPMYLLEQMRHQSPSKRIMVLTLIFVSLGIIGSSAEHLNAQTRYGTQLKNNVLQSFRYLKQHYLPHCC